MADQCDAPAAVVAESEERSFVFKVRGYSSAKKLLKIGEYVTSSLLNVEGHNWALSYFPNGRSPADDGYLVVILDPVDDAKDVNAEARCISLHAKNEPAPYVRIMIEKMSTHTSSYFCLLINKAGLEQSGDIIDDCFSVRCVIALNKDIKSEETKGSDQLVVVPPSDLHRHLGNLLETMDGADVTFLVGGENFSAHRLMLAARSSVFKAELLGPMKEKGDSLIEIHEMEAGVFKCLLHFIYTDSLPVLDMAQHLDVMMAGHLLVAADRYNVERLKLICEHKLCNHIDAGMVATSLVLAEQHSCHGLKKACLQFLASPSNLHAMMSSDGYEHLKSSCPSVLGELIARLPPIPYWKRPRISSWQFSSVAHDHRK